MITIAVVGILKGFDALQNLVLDDVKEEGTGESQGRIGRDRSLNALADRISSNHDNDVADGRPSRTLGLVVLRGPQITLISPTDGYEGESLDHLRFSGIANMWMGIERLIDSTFCLYLSTVEISNPFAQAE